LIGKIEWHSSYHSPFPPSGVQFICGAVSPSRLRASTRRDDVSKSECGFYDPRTSFDLGRDPRISRPPPLRQAELPLQRRQIRSPAQALSKTVLHLRHARNRRPYPPGSRASSVVMHDIWG
jgi:hypothetical protein